MSKISFEFKVYAIVFEFLVNVETKKEKKTVL